MGSAVALSVVCFYLQHYFRDPFHDDGKFEAHPAPFRGIALAVSIGVAYWTRSAVGGMIVGMMFVLVLSWLC